MLVKKIIFCHGKTVTVNDITRLQVMGCVMCLGPKRKFRLHPGFILTLRNHKVGTINFQILPGNPPELFSLG